MTSSPSARSICSPGRGYAAQLSQPALPLASSKAFSYKPARLRTLCFKLWRLGSYLVRRAMGKLGGTGHLNRILGSLIPLSVQSESKGSIYAANTARISPFPRQSNGAGSTCAGGVIFCLLSVRSICKTIMGVGVGTGMPFVLKGIRRPSCFWGLAKLRVVHVNILKILTLFTLPCTTRETQRN